MITIGVYNTHRVIRQAVGALLDRNADFRVVLLECDPLHIADRIKIEGISVLVFTIHDIADPAFALIRQLSQRFERLRILVMSHADNESLIVKSIKSGAKGFLAGDSDQQELYEAIYTLRNGFDFYSKSIAHLLLGRYIGGIMSDKPAPGVESLSARQIEILKLWGNNMSNKEIAEALYLSVRTVESHKNHIMQKLNLKTTVDMIKFGIRNNLIDL